MRKHGRGHFATTGASQWAHGAARGLDGKLLPSRLAPPRHRPLRGMLHPFFPQGTETLTWFFSCPLRDQIWCGLCCHRGTSLFFVSPEVAAKGVQNFREHLLPGCKKVVDFIYPPSHPPYLVPNFKPQVCGRLLAVTSARVVTFSPLFFPVVLPMAWVVSRVRT